MSIRKSMARGAKKFEEAKKSLLVWISVLAFLVFAWLLFYGKIKAAGLLSPILGKLPRDEVGLMKMTEDVLGKAVEKIKGENVQKAVKKSSEFFESSQYAEPAREVRDEVKEKIDQTIESAKELPAKEIKHIQLEICKEWLGEEMLATESGEVK